MSQPQYYLHPDGKGRFLLQGTETGLIDGLLFPGMPGESAHAFSHDYGTVFYPHQILNLANFPELADMPFFTLEGCNHYHLEAYFKQTECQSLWPLLGAFGKFTNFSPSPSATASKLAKQTAQETDSVLWQFQVSNPKGSWVIPILDVWVNEQGCWLCTREGQVLVLNHQGELIQQYSFPKLTRCLTPGEDEETPYVSCDDGNLYELTGKLPQVVYGVRPAGDYRYSYQILALEHTPQVLLISDAYGYLRVLDTDFELRWQQYDPGFWQGWFLARDEDRVYHGHYQGVSAYDLNTGKSQWLQPLPAPVLCGCLTRDEVIVGCGDRQLYALKKIGDLKTRETQTRILQTCTGMPYAMTRADRAAALPFSFWVGDYAGKIERLNGQGQGQELVEVKGGAVTALQVWGDRLYVATSQGWLICLGLSARSC